MTASDLVALFEVPAGEAAALLSRRRPKAITLTHATHGEVTLGDNIPLNEKRLAACLDDSMTPAEWLMLLNTRTFFFTNRRDAQPFLEAGHKAGGSLEVRAFDTRALGEAYGSCMEVAPINTGATVHIPARRGRSTFTALHDVDWPVWWRQRGKKSPDRIKEVVVTRSIPDIAQFMLPDA